MSFDFSIPVAFDLERKLQFHRGALLRLEGLALLLGLPPGSYEVRSNPGGIAVSGEVTLHHERFSLQVAQSCLGPQHGILYRSCRGRQDYCGGQNRFAPLQLLNDLSALARKVREVLDYPAP